MPSYVRGSDNFDSGQVIGQNQTWQDVIASRVAGATYTNTTGKPIMVSITAIGVSTGGNYSLSVSIDGVIRAYAQVTEAQSVWNQFTNSIQIIVPNGSTYSAGGSVSISLWHELR